MATIVENISGDKALQMGNEEFVRKLGYGTNWTKLRIGCRLCVNGTADIATPRFQLGLCVGDVYTFASASCIQYVGYPTNELGNLGYNGALLSYAFQESSNCPYVTKVGATATYNIIGGAGHPPGNYAAGVSGRTSIVAAQFTKLSATSIQVNGSYTTDAQYANVPVTYHLLRSLDDEVGTSAFTATYFSWMNARTVTMSNVVDLDTVSVYWGHSSPTVEVHDIIIVRYY
jgi:hypothetical protein